MRLPATAFVAALGMFAACAVDESAGFDAQPNDVGLALSAMALCPPVPCTPDGSAVVCDDGLIMTWDICTGGFCENKPIAATCTPGPSLDCDDNNPCTSDVCKKADPCHAVPNCHNIQTPNCCLDNPDCDDGVYCTADTCNIATQTCTHKPKPACCDTSEQCDDGAACTVGWCVNYVCYQTLAVGQTGCKPPKPPPCESWMDCDDGLACTTDYCQKGDCKHAKLEACCEGEGDALVACDDKCGCTVDYCLNNTCRHTVPKNGCCCSKASCFDGVKGTIDTCVNISPQTGMGVCKFSKDPSFAGCCTPDTTPGDSSCNDNNLCTLDACFGCLCVHKPVVNCCLDKHDCDDGHPCTVDVCVYDQCINWVLQSNQGCCTPQTEESDCWSENSAAFQGKWLQQPNGLYKCAKVPKG